jgi:hypothetical protein
MQAGSANPFVFSRPMPSEIKGIPDPSPELRQALFGLGPNTVAVEPNQSKTVYYVMTLRETLPVEVADLYARFGPQISLQMEVQRDSERARIEAWMKELRKRAGVPDNWIPPDEAKLVAAAGGDSAETR